MASRWDYPDPATAFTNAFMASFTPFLQARLQSDEKARIAATERIIDNYDRAKAALTASNAEGAQYLRDANALVGMLGDNLNGIPKETMTAYAANVIRWHGGNVAQAQEYITNQINNQLISMQDMNEATTIAAREGSRNAPAPSVPAGGGLDAQTRDVFTNRLVNRESSSNPTAWNTDRNGNLYAGLYQFGDARLAEVNAALGTNYSAMDIKMGLVPEAEQHRMGEWHFGQIDNFITENNLDRFIGTTINGTVVTANGMRAVAHLGGNNGLKRYLESGGGYNPHDGKEGVVGTYLSDYMRHFGEGGSPSTAGATSPSTAGATSPTSRGPSLAATYNLSSLSDVSTKDDRPFGQRISDGIRQLFNPNDQSYILTQARREAKRQLEASGDLATYEAMVSGQLTLANTVGGFDGIRFDTTRAGMDPMPNIATIGSQREIDAIRIGIETGAINADENDLSALDMLEARFAGLPEGLPKDLMELNSEQAIRNAKTIYDTLSAEELARLPVGYGTRLSALFATVDEGGSLTMNGIFNRLTSLEAAANREGATQEDKDAYGMYVNQSLVPLVDQVLATSTDVTSAERMNVLASIADRVSGKEGVSESVLSGLQGSFERVRQTAAAAANPEGSTRQVVVSDGNGGFEYREIITRPTLNGTEQYYIDPATGQRTPFDGRGVINLPEGHLEARQTIANQMDDQKQRYDAAMVANRGFLSTLGQMGRLVANDPNILGADVVNNLGGLYVDITRNVEVATNRLSQLNGNPDAQRNFFTSADAEGIILELERQVEAIEANPMRNNAANFALFKAKQVLATYQIGRLEGQSGTAMSNRDFENFARAINARSAKEFMEGMGAYVRSMDASMDIRHNDLMTDPRVQAWESTINGQIPFWSGNMGLKRFTDDFDRWSPEEQLGYRMFLGDPETDDDPEEPKPDWTFDPSTATLTLD